MDSTKCATFAVVAQFLVAFSNMASAETRSLQAGLVDDLHHWIDTETALPTATTPAKIVFMDAQDLAGPSEMASMIGSVPRGLYDPDTGTITLVRPWSADNPQDGPT